VSKGDCSPLPSVQFKCGACGWKALAHVADDDFPEPQVRLAQAARDEHAAETGHQSGDVRAVFKCGSHPEHEPPTFTPDASGMAEARASFAEHTASQETER
jgi:hypothetical protein